jgi:hypothetical protein
MESPDAFAQSTIGRDGDPDIGTSVVPFIPEHVKPGGQLLL